jgi:nitroreductase
MTHTESEFSVLRAIYGRRAVRAYSAKQPEDATLRHLLDAAVQAPTAMHAEPWGFVVIQDKARLKRYSDRAKSMAHETSLPVGWGSLALGHAEEHLSMLHDPAFNIFYDAGTLVVVCRTAAGAFSEADCWLAAQNFMLAAAAEGLGTCCIGLAVPVLNVPAVKRELGIPEEGAAVAPIIVGVPGAPPPARSARKAPRILSWVR